MDSGDYPANISVLAKSPVFEIPWTRWTSGLRPHTAGHPARDFGIIVERRRKALSKGHHHLIAYFHKDLRPLLIKSLRLRYKLGLENVLFVSLILATRNTYTTTLPTKTTQLYRFLTWRLQRHGSKRLLMVRPQN